MTSRTRTWALGLLLLGGCQCGKPVPHAASVDAGGAVTAAPVPAPQPKQVLEAIVLEISGSAEVLHPGTQDWVSLALGDPVRLGDAIRTADDGEVSLGFGAASLRVQQGSRLDLQLFEPHRLRASLDGRAEAKTPDGSMRIELTGPGGGLASLSSGRAALRSEGLDDAAAAALEGKLTLSADGKETELQPGELSVLQRGQPWSEGSALARRPVLRVGWPSLLLTNKSELSLEGRSGRMTRVFVQGHVVKTAADGSFEAQVHLHRGKQRIRVVAVDALGNTLTRSRVITLDPDAPTIRAKVHFR